MAVTTAQQVELLLGTLAPCIQVLAEIPTPLFLAQLLPNGPGKAADDAPST